MIDVEDIVLIMCITRPLDMPRLYQWEHIVHKFALLLSDKDECFDIGRFLDACGASRMGVA